MKNFLLGAGLIWITINIFYLPFFAWTTGMVRSWFILHGYVPYRDFVWLRNPFDLFLLAGWFKIFGVSPVGYQFFIYIIFIILTVFIFLLSRHLVPKGKSLPFLFYLVFLFPLVYTTEMGELLIGLWALLLLGTMFCYLQTGNSHLLLLSGIISGTSLITKQNSGGIILAVLATICFDAYRQKKLFSVWIRRCSCYVAGLLIPVFLLIAYLIHHQALQDFLYYTIGIVLGPYRTAPLPPGFSRGDGLWIEAGYLVLLIPFLFFWKRTGLSPQKVVFLALLIISLYPSLLPSFLSYRAFTAYPLVAVLAGYDLLLLKGKKEKSVVILSFLLFIIFSLRFIHPYILFIRYEGFHANDFIKDYGQPELEAAAWIKNNTDKDEKIMSFTNNIVYLLSDRLPKNKYVDPFPTGLLPYDKSSGVFMTNPPRIMVFDEALLQDFPDLSNWPFYQYLHQEYRAVKQFGSLVIYKYD